MAFSNPVASADGGIITQTGTNNTQNFISELSAVTGVTIQTGSNGVANDISIINIGANRINVEGTVNINPNQIMLICNSGSACLNIQSSGSFTAASEDHVNPYLDADVAAATATNTQTPFIIYNGTGQWHNSGPGTGAGANAANQYGVFNIEEDGGFLLLDGVTIVANRAFSIGAAAPSEGGGFINSTYVNSIYAAGSTSRGSIIQTYDPGLFSLDNSVLIGMEFLPNRPQTLTGLTRRAATSAVFNAGRANGALVVRNFNFRNNYADFSYESNSPNVQQTYAYNSERGSELEIFNPVASGSFVFAYFRQLQTNVVDLNGDGLSGVHLYMRDYNNNARKNVTRANIFTGGSSVFNEADIPDNYYHTGTGTTLRFDQTSDYIYIADTDTDGSILTSNYFVDGVAGAIRTDSLALDIMIMNFLAAGVATRNVVALTTHTGASVDITSNVIDKRTIEHNLGRDVMEAWLFRYENEIAYFNLDLIGQEEFILNHIALPDAAVTGSRADIQTLFGTHAPTITNADISLAARPEGYTLDEIYDLIKWQKTETGRTGYEITGTSVYTTTALATVSKPNPLLGVLEFGNITTLKGEDLADLQVNANLTAGVNHTTIDFQTVEVNSNDLTGITIVESIINNVGNLTNCNITSESNIVPATTHTWTDSTITATGTGTAGDINLTQITFDGDNILTANTFNIGANTNLTDLTMSGSATLPQDKQFLNVDWNSGTVTFDTAGRYAFDLLTDFTGATVEPATGVTYSYPSEVDDVSLPAWIPTGWTRTTELFTRTIEHEDFDGVWAVYNADTNQVVRAAVTYTTGGAPNNFEVTNQDSNNYNIYWYRNGAVGEAYLTRVLEIRGTRDVLATQLDVITATAIPAVLWQDAVGIQDTVDARAVIVAGASETGSAGTIDLTGRAQIQYTNTTGELQGPATAAINTLFRTLQARNDSTVYITRMGGSGLTNDYILPGVGEVQVDSRHAYFDTGDTNTQNITGAAAIVPSTLADLTPVTLALAGGGTTPSVNIFPNPDGATPGQISSAVTDALNSSGVPNAAGWLVGGNASRIPVKTTYSNTDDYTSNL